MKNTYYVIGLMSGSSLDGLDIVYAEFSYKGKWEFNILNTKVVSLNSWTNILPKAVELNKQNLDNLSIIFGVFLGEETKLFIEENNIKDIDIIVSHGHTIFHYPEKGITCQIGDGPTMAEILKLPILNNLRQKDIEAGGQGAPIVPIGDLHLFSNHKFCLNIGGIANISIKQNNKIIAYDIAVANQILNYYSLMLGAEYDDNGNWAREGTVITDLLEELKKLEFYKKEAPKSLDNSYKEKIKKVISFYNLSPKDILATYTYHLAGQIAKEANKYCNAQSETMLITGGGAYNNYLIELIQQQFKGKICIPSSEIIAYKEALVMAFMGVLYLRNEANVLSSVTGAKQDTICGEVHQF